MRKVIIAPEGLPIPPSKGGSIQIYLNHLVKEMTLIDSELELVCPGAKTTHPQVHTVGVGLGKTAYRRRVLARLAKLQPRVIQIDNRPDFVGPIRQRFPAAKIVLNLHSNTFLGPRNIGHQQAFTALTQADKVVVNSHYLRDNVRRKFALNSQWQAAVIYPGVDLQRFGRPANTPPTHVAKILFVGRVIRQKGVHVLIEAFKQLIAQGHKLILTIIGKTPPWESAYRTHLLSLSRGLPIRWLGFVTPERLPAYLWQSDLLVCPSQRNEAFGLVNIEAMAAGVPVIASDVGGIPEIVTPKAGQLIAEYHNPSAFAAAIAQLIADPTAFRALSAGARARAEDFTWTQTARRFLDLYHALL